MKYIELICYKQVLLWQEENVESLSSLLPVKSLIKEHGHAGTGFTFFHSDGDEVVPEGKNG